MNHIDTEIRHVTRAEGNIFADLGFEPAEATNLLAEADRMIAEKLALKETLMTEIAKWIEESNLKQADAARVLGVTRPRVSDVVHKKTVKFTIDALFDMLGRAGKHVIVSVH